MQDLMQVRSGHHQLPRWDSAGPQLLRAACAMSAVCAAAACVLTERGGGGHACVLTEHGGGGHACVLTEHGEGGHACVLNEHGGGGYNEYIINVSPK